MRLLILAFSYLFAGSLAWSLPERCKQNARTRRSTDSTSVEAKTIFSIQQVAEAQTEALKQRYTDYQFIGLPIRAEECYKSAYPPYRLMRTVYGASNCDFHTSTPRLLSSVACHSGTCKLVHTVSTQDSYTELAGFKWAAKASVKYSIPHVFEISGEVSGEGTSYSCAYSVGKTTTDTVECTGPPGVRGQLQLFNVITDMKCDFGHVTFVTDYRNDSCFKLSDAGFLSDREYEELKASASLKAVCFDDDLIIDTDKISDHLLRKIIREFPQYNPYADMIRMEYDNRIEVNNFKKTVVDKEFSRVIPFTNENGDAVYQYACMFTPT